MVFCPVHSRYYRGRKSKRKHAWGIGDKKKGCKWMRDYIYKNNEV